jgi:hypothetical protein
MEARMARIESMMDSLIQERALSTTPQGSVERDEAISDTLLNESAIQSGSDMVTPQLSRVRLASFKLESPDRSRPPISVLSPSSGADSPATVRVGAKSYAFPNPTHVQKYVDIFFSDVASYYPCVNEADFRIRSEKLLAARAIYAGDICLLALNFLVFACSDIVVAASSSLGNNRPAGWQWYQQAEELISRRDIYGQGDLSLIQVLIIKVRFSAHFLDI